MRRRWKALVVLLLCAAAGLWFYDGMVRTYGAYSIVRRTNCASQLKYVSRGMLLYTEANDGRFPPSKGWADVIAGFFPAQRMGEDTFRCPCDPNLAGPDKFGYAYNSKLAGKRDSELFQPEYIPMVFESTNFSRNAADPMTTFSGNLPRDNPDSARNWMVCASGDLRRVGR